MYTIHTIKYKLNANTIKKKTNQKHKQTNLVIGVRQQLHSGVLIIFDVLLLTSSTNVIFSSPGRLLKT